MCVCVCVCVCLTVFVCVHKTGSLIHEMAFPGNWKLISVLCFPIKMFQINSVAPYSGSKVMEAQEENTCILNMLLFITINY